MERKPYLTLAVASIFLSIYLFSLGEPLNRDGILYLQAAGAFQQGGWQQAVGVYFWPPLSVFISAVSSVTHLSLLHSAYVINALLALWLVLGFMRLCSVLGGGEKTLWLAGLLILTHLHLNDFREQVIRGFGFWAAVVSAVTCQLLYLRTRKLGHAVLWHACFIFGILFRVEAVFFWLASGLVFLLQAQVPLSKRLRDTGLFYLPALLCLGAAIVLLPRMADGSRLLGMVSTIPAHLQQLSAHLQTMTGVLMQSLHVGGKEAGLIFILGKLSYFIYEFIKVTLPVYVLVGLIALLKYRRQFDKTAMRVVVFYSVLALVPTLALYFCGYPLARRYVFMGSLFFLSLLPVTLERLWEFSRCYYQKVNPANAALAAVACYMLFAGIVSVVHLPKTSKHYVRRAGQWLHHHAPHAKIIANDYQLAFYALGDASLIPEGERYDAEPNRIQLVWSQYDYIAVRDRAESADLVNFLRAREGLKQVHIFARDKHHRVIIFKRV